VEPGTSKDEPGRSRALWIAAAVLVAAIAAGGTALGLSLGGGSDSGNAATGSASVPTTAPIAPTTTSTSTEQKAPPSPTLTAIRATFVEAEKTTFYRIGVRGTKEKVDYSWSLQAPKSDTGCNNFEVLGPGLAAWHHGGDQGCSHVGIQHEGTVSVRVETPSWICHASFFGSLTRSGPPAGACAIKS
jgi:hypothetical protein